MSSELERFLRQGKDGLSRSLLHVSSARSKAFTRIAAAIRKNDFARAGSLIEEERASGFYGKIADSIATSREKLAGLISDIKERGGPLASIVIGLTMVAAGALLLKGAVAATGLTAIIVALMMLVGILIALKGVARLTRTALAR